MGSRAVVIVCRNDEAARKRFGVVGDGAGICYTRTGRRFFDDRKLEAEMLDTVRTALDKTGFWEEFKTDWVCLDCELMPWSAKAQALIKEQYAAVGVAAMTGLQGSVAALEQAQARLPEVAPLLDRHRERLQLVRKYTAAYRHYCWNVTTVDDLRLAPFHLLASEGKVHMDRDHLWHMETLARIAAAGDPVFLATPYKVVDLSSQAGEDDATNWWSSL